MVGSVLFGTLLVFNPWWGPSSLGLINFLTHGGVRPLWDFISFLTHGGVRPLQDLLIFNPWWGPSSLGLY